MDALWRQSVTGCRRLRGRRRRRRGRYSGRLVPTLEGDAPNPTALIVGDVAAVKAAIDAGSKAAERVGEVIGVQVLPRPHEDLGAVLPIAGKKQTPATVSAS